MPPGTPVAAMDRGFSEFGVHPAARLMRVPSPTPEARPGALCGALRRAFALSGHAARARRRAGPCFLLRKALARQAISFALARPAHPWNPQVQVRPQPPAAPLAVWDSASFSPSPGRPARCWRS
jgi:hypothetical protein